MFLATSSSDNVWPPMMMYLKILTKIEFLTYGGPLSKTRIMFVSKKSCQGWVL